MRAYNMSMIVILINAGYAIMDQMGVFGADVAHRAGGFDALSWLAAPIFTIPVIDLDVTGVLALATVIAGATVVVLNTNLVNDRGVAIAVFAFIFYTSIFVAGVTIFKNHNMPGVELFYTIYIVICTLLFIISIVQMPTGGQKNYV